MPVRAIRINPIIPPNIRVVLSTRSPARMAKLRDDRTPPRIECGAEFSLQNAFGECDYFTDENEVGTSNWLTMLPTI